MRSPNSTACIRATAGALVCALAAACNSAERATAPSHHAPADARKASREVYVPTVPIIPCADTIFKGNFAADKLDTFPGAPAIGSWTAIQPGGSIHVRSSVGGLINKPVELTRDAGSSGAVQLNGKIRCTSAASTGLVMVDWRSLVHSATVTQGGIVLRDDHTRAVAMVAYLANGVVAYNGIVVPGVSWVKDIPHRFRIALYLTGRKSVLYVDGQLKLANVPYYHPDASNLWRIGMELGGVGPQSFAWDDIVVARYAW